MARFDANEAYNQELSQATGLPAMDTPVAPEHAAPMPMFGAQSNPMAPPTEVAPADSYDPGPPPADVHGRRGHAPVGAGRYGEPDVVASEGFEDIDHGYGAAPQASAPTPAPVPAAASAEPRGEIGSAEWVAAIRVMAISDQGRLQQYLTDHPEAFGAVRAAINPDAATTGLTAAPQQGSAAPSEFASPRHAAAPSAAEEKVRASDLDHVAKTGWRGWVARTFNVELGKGKRELIADDLDMAADIIGKALEVFQDTGQGLVLGVSSFKGGCGKTRIAVMLAKVIAEMLHKELDATGYRLGNYTAWGAVCAIDTDWYGMLRACSEPESTLRSGDADNMTTLCSRAEVYGVEQIDLEHYAHRVEPGYSYIPGNRKGEATRLSVDGYAAVVNLLRANFPVVVVDMAQVGNTEHYQTVLRSLDGLIMVTLPSMAEVDFLDNTRNMLSDRAPSGMGADRLIKQRITVINNIKRAKGDASQADVAAKLKLHESAAGETENPRGSDVAEVPFDKRINSRELVIAAELTPNTRYGIEMAGAALIDATLDLTGRG